MPNTRISRRYAALPALAASLGLALGCFSERADVTDPTAAVDCPALSLGLEDLGSIVLAIDDFNFHPDTVRVSAGDRVTWVNCEPEGTAAHTVTSDEDVWDTSEFARGGIHTETFSEPGVYPYHCRPHPWMQAVVVVE